MTEEPAAERQWTTADDALWRTLTLVADRIARRAPKGLALSPVMLAPDEIALASDAFVMEALIDAETDDYVRTAGPAFEGDSPLDPGPGTAWDPDFQGTITVTTHGFYLDTETGVHRWMWRDVNRAEVIGFTGVVLQGASENGTINWRLRSNWAELVFALWALTVDPNHSQLRTRTWLPVRWIEWAATVGRPVPSEVLSLLP